MLTSVTQGQFTIVDRVPPKATVDIKFQLGKNTTMYNNFKVKT